MIAEKKDGYGVRPNPSFHFLDKNPNLPALSPCHAWPCL